MRSDSRLARLFAAVFILAWGSRVAAGAGHTEQAASQTAQETLGVKGTGTERTVESQRRVIVQDTKKVIDADTGQVLKTEETKTPVTVTEQKTVERRVDVTSGETKKTAE
jgi:hypothetical protein